MNLGEWKVNIIQRPQYMKYRIYLMQYIKGGVIFLTHDGLGRTIQEGGDYSDDEVYFAEMDNDQLHAFADGLASIGVKTINDYKNEGLLEATRYHLEDMRLIALPKPKANKTPNVMDKK